MAVRGTSLSWIAAQMPGHTLHTALVEPVLNPEQNLWPVCQILQEPELIRTVQYAVITAAPTSRLCSQYLDTDPLGGGGACHPATKASPADMRVGEADFLLTGCALHCAELPYCHMTLPDLAAC